MPRTPARRRKRGPTTKKGFIPLGTGSKVGGERLPDAQKWPQEARQPPKPPKTAIGAAERPERPQTLILKDFPTPLQVRVLGPNASTANRYALNAMRQRVQGLVKIEAQRQRILALPPPVAVILRFVLPDARARDEDNFAIIGKPVVDGLVRAGILTGDDSRRLTRRVEIVKERGQRRLEIVLAPAGDRRPGEV